MVVKAAGRTKLLRQLLPAETETLYGNLEEDARVRTLGGIASMASEP
jgi:hypothetical protein